MFGLLLHNPGSNFLMMTFRFVALGGCLSQLERRVVGGATITSGTYLFAASGVASEGQVLATCVVSVDVS